MLTHNEALKLAEQYVAEVAGEAFQVIPGTLHEDGELFVFYYNTRQSVATGNPLFGTVGQGPVIIDRLDGRIAAYGSATEQAAALAGYRQRKETWAAVRREFPFVGFEEGRYTLRITKVYRKQPLLQALLSVGLTYVLPTASAGIIWRVAQAYTPAVLEQRLKQQPTAFDDLSAETIVALYPLLKQAWVCAFEVTPYHPKPHAKYVDRATAQDYEPRW